MARQLVPHRYRTRILALVVLIACITGLALSLVVCPPHALGLTWDDALVGREPPQITDIRSALGAAVVHAKRAEWSIATRLAKDAQAQWECFRLQIPTIYGDGRWRSRDVERANASWQVTVQRAEREDLNRMVQAIGRLQSIMDRYRSP